MSRPPVLVASVLIALALSLSACGASTEEPDAGPPADDTATATTDTDVDSAQEGTGDGAATDTGSDQADEAAEAEETEAGPAADQGDEGAAQAETPADVVIEGSFSGGEILIDDRRFDVSIGSSVLIIFESDEVEHVHLHGYDILADLVPGEPAEIAFVADSPGTFEVELEDSGRFLFELLVR